MKTIKCFNCGKMGHFAFNCTKFNKDEESVGSNGIGVDPLNFEKFEDDENCESVEIIISISENSKIKTTYRPIKT